jgi:hypothetical protein
MIWSLETSVCPEPSDDVLDGNRQASKVNATYSSGGSKEHIAGGRPIRLRASFATRRLPLGAPAGILNNGDGETNLRQRERARIGRPCRSTVHQKAPNSLVSRNCCFKVIKPLVDSDDARALPQAY